MRLSFIIDLSPSALDDLQTSSAVLGLLTKLNHVHPTPWNSNATVIRSVLESHAHLHWVILNAGKTLLATTDHELDAFISRVAYAYKVTVDEAKTFVEGIQLIYKRWVLKGKGCGASRIISFIKKAVDRVRGRATRTQTASSSVAASPQ